LAEAKATGRRPAASRYQICGIVLERKSVWISNGLEKEKLNGDEELSLG
jgi:hypothetical protein